MSESHLERLMAFHIRAAGLPEPEREYRFLEGRTFRFDFAWPEQRLALEVEGGIWLNGRHTRGAGFQTDCWKYNEAAAGGWRVLRVTEELITNGMAVKWLERMLEIKV